MSLDENAVAREDGDSSDDWRGTRPQVDGFEDKVAFIWSVADRLRGDYRPHEYGSVILPLTVIRRLDQVLEPTKAAVIAEAQKRRQEGIENLDPLLQRVAKQQFWNESKLTLTGLLADPALVADNLRAYIAGFSPLAREAIDKFDFDRQIDRLERSNLLYPVLSQFVAVDLHPDRVSSMAMGYIFEELIRKFAEQSNETAGEHFTPREVIRLMVNILLIEDEDALRTPGTLRTIYDCACGTGGMLSEAEEHLREINPDATLKVYGQELNPESYAICLADMLVKGQDASNIAFGNSFSQDGHKGRHFDYCIANPPFGVEWKKVEKEVRDEHERLGFDGRFGAGLPRINDGSFLFLQHLISKMKPVEQGGSRVAIVFNGSPLFTGTAGSGESEIRRWIIENDWLEAVVALPDQLFYNTGISTYFWIVTNRKSPARKGKVQLVDAREMCVKMRKSLGEKRKEISPQQMADIARFYGSFIEGDEVKILPNEAFGYMRITVERPLRLRWEVSEETVASLTETKAWDKLAGPEQADVRARLDELVGTMSFNKRDLADRLGRLPKGVEKPLWDAVGVRDTGAPVITDRKGEAHPDPELRDTENVPLPATPATWHTDPTDRLAKVEYREACRAYMDAEVLPFVPDAWVDQDKTRIGYQIPLTRHFYKYVPPRALAEIDAEIKALEAGIQKLLAEVAE